MQQNNLSNENRKILSEIIHFGYVYKLSSDEMYTIIEDHKSMMVSAQNEGRSFLETNNTCHKQYAQDVVMSVEGIYSHSFLRRLSNKLVYVFASIFGILIAEVLIFSSNQESYIIPLSKAEVFYNISITPYMLAQVTCFALSIYLINSIHIAFSTRKKYEEYTHSFFKRIYKQVIGILVLIIVFLFSENLFSKDTLVKLNGLFILIPTLIFIVIYFIDAYKKMNAIDKTK